MSEFVVLRCDENSHQHNRRLLFQGISVSSWFCPTGITDRGHKVSQNVSQRAPKMNPLISAALETKARNTVNCYSGRPGQGLEGTDMLVGQQLLQMEMRESNSSSTVPQTSRTIRLSSSRLNDYHDRRVKTAALIKLNGSRRFTDDNFQPVILPLQKPAGFSLDCPDILPSQKSSSTPISPDLNRSFEMHLRRRHGRQFPFRGRPKYWSSGEQENRNFQEIIHTISAPETVPEQIEERKPRSRPSVIKSRPLLLPLVYDEVLAECQLLQSACASGKYRQSTFRACLTADESVDGQPGEEGEDVARRASGGRESVCRRGQRKSARRRIVHMPWKEDMTAAMLAPHSSSN